MQALVIVLLASGAFAAPFRGSNEILKEDNQCAKKHLRFKYGKEYSYDYVGETISSVNGSSSAHSALKIKARCSIKSVGPCQHVLKIDSVELWEAQSMNLPLKFRLSKDTASFARELTAHELIFRSSNGAIVEVSPDAEESPKILNIKKGIVSALQLQFSKKQQTVLKETDVAGECPVQYRVHSKYLTGREKVISKARNLRDCSQRAKTNLGIHFHLYEEKSLNLLSSSSNCRYIVTSKSHIQKVVCYERHLFRPFSSGLSAGASTVTKQILELTKVSNGHSFGIGIKGRPSFPLSYQHNDPKPDILDSEKVINIIKQLARQSMEETKPDSARIFAKVVYALRKLDSRAAMKVWDTIQKCDECKPEEKERFQMFLLDALPHCGTDGCAQVISHAIKMDLVNGERGNMFLAGLGLVSRSTEKMIRHVLDLCQAKISRTAMLTLGTLIHKFCESENCNNLDSKSPIYDAENMLIGLIGKNCNSKNTVETENIIMALKAIGNAGRPFNVDRVLLKCAMNHDVPRNLSISALEALRRMPCNKVTQSQLLNIYGDHHFDVEVRIASYLALLKCPSIYLFKKIAEIQQSELSNQVGSFVWSHITNAMESSEPVYGRPLANMIRKALDGKVLREFNLNRLKFSRAWEASYYNEILRAGGSMQGHLIYHPNSFFPRSTQVNVTVDILGASINVLEAAARFEGGEILIEQMFGDDGLYPDKKIMEMFNLVPHEERDDSEKEISGMTIRGRRSIKDDMDKVEPELGQLKKKMTKGDVKPSGAVSMKLFGNEIRLASFDDINWLQTEADNINMVDLLIKLSRGGQKTFTKSMMFLDVETTVPTMLGLPLKLDAKGTTVVSVEMKGKMDIRNMFWGPMAFDIRGHLKPSAVVEIAGRMGVDAIYAESGILVNSSLYTSTEIKGNATYKQGQRLSFEIGAPTKPIQIFNISSSVFATLNDEELKIEGTKRRIEPAPCLNFTRALGLAVCGRMSLPVAFRDLEAPFFPLSGPASFSLSVLPTDPKLRLYQIIAERRPTKDEQNYDYIARISTPNATWEREFEANVSLWLKEHQKSFSVSTGALGYNFGNISGSYHNVTNAINITFDARDVIYGNRIILNGQYFNTTDPKTSERHVGTKLCASYKNYTITQLTEVYNKSRTYGILSNTSYWPGKYIFANAELSIPKKRIDVIANHTCSKTSLKFNGQLGEEKNTFLFNFTNELVNVSVETKGSMDKRKNEATLKTFVLPHKQSFTIESRYISQEYEKGLHFRASHDNKNRVFAWYTGLLNQTNEKALKTNATVLGEPFEAQWTFFNFTSEKGFKFNSTALGKSVNSAISLITKDGLQKIKIHGSALNKTAEAVWSYIRSGVRRSLIFNANIVNKTFNADLTFNNLTNIKSVNFDATGLNKTLSAAWTLIRSKNENTLKFNVSALNETIEAFWKYSRLDTVKSINFNASGFNKTIETALLFFNLPEEKTIKINATALNKQLEAVWTFFKLPTEKGLKFSFKGLKKSASTCISFVDLPTTKSMKVNATAMNKTVEAAWSYLTNQNEKTLKFNANAVNKTMQALWTYFNFKSEKGLRFNAQAMNKSIEGVWSYFTNTAVKGLKFNATVLKKTVNASVSYFKLPDSIGVQFNASALNRSLGIFSKILKEGDDKTFTFGGAYQNYSLAAFASLKNLTSVKSLCFHTEFLGQRYGEVCATYFNSSFDRSLALNISMLNRTAEVKAQRYENPNSCALRLSSKYNDITLMDMWLSYYHNDTLKKVGMDLTIVKKTGGFEVFIKHEPEHSERTFGVNIDVLNKSTGIKAIMVNHKNMKHLSTHLMWNKSSIVHSSLVFQNRTSEKLFEVRYHVGRYAAVMKTVYRTPRSGQHELELVHLIRNHTTMIFYDSSTVVYKSKQRTRKVNFVFALSTLGRKFKYGWDLSHTNRSTESTLEHEMNAGLMYSSDKRVSVTGTVSNNKNKFATFINVEYLPGKTVQHSIEWNKDRKRVITTVELLPRIILRNSIEWNTDNGLYVRSITTAFQRTMTSYFRFIRKRESYDGQIEYWPSMKMSFNGQFSRRNGLLVTSTIEALAKKWSHKLDINKQHRKLFISIDFMPQKPASFEASWDRVEGLKINTKMSALKKSLKFDAFFKKISDTWKSDITIMKEKVLFFGNLDKNTKTLNASVQIRNRRIGFVGRFDLKAYVVSAHMTCNEHMTGWFLKLNRDARNIIFNSTLTSRISGQVVAEMPNNNQLQVTAQRKLGVNIVNESRVMYKLSPEASRIFLTWNTTTVNYVASKIQSLMPLIVTETLKVYNQSLIGAKNMTKQIEMIVKKMELKVKPHVMKLYKTVKDYDYSGVYQNFSIIAKNISVKAVNFTSKAYNISLKTLNKAIKDLPMLARNATALYRKINNEVMKIKSEELPKIKKQVQVQIEKVKQHLENIRVHIVNISRDLQSWSHNVTMMVGDITIRNVKIGHVVKRTAKVVTELQEQIMKNVTAQAKKLLKKVREIEIRKVNISKMVDKLIQDAREFSCDFDAKCTLKNVSLIAKKISRQVMKYSVLNKTLEQHLNDLTEKTINATIQAKILSKKLVKIAPTFVRNTTVKAIHLLRNLSMEARILSKNLAKKVRLAATNVSMNVQKYTKPLTKLIVKLSFSMYNRVKPQIELYIERVQPSIKYMKGLYSDVLNFTKPVFLPFGPMSKDILQQLMSITIKTIPVGAVLEQNLKTTLEEAGKLFNDYNHTITNNVTAIIQLINDLSKKTPEEIVDITVLKVFKLVNHTKELLNKTFEYTFASSKNAAKAYKESMAALDLKIKTILQMRPEDVVELSIQNIHMSIKNMTAFVKNISLEIQSVAKQLNKLDFETPFMTLWKEIDLLNRYTSLSLGEKWDKTVEEYMRLFKSLNLTERAMNFKSRYEQQGQRIMKEIIEAAMFGDRFMNLTMKLWRMQVTREEFVKELLSIAEGSKLLAKKHFHIARDATFALYTMHTKYWDTAVKSLANYKNMSMDKIQGSYKNMEKYIVEFSKEHEPEFKEAYEFYKDIALDIYDAGEKEVQIVKERAMRKLDELKKKLVLQLESLAHKFKKYENMTYEDMASLTYQLSKKVAHELYGNYSIKAIALYNNTKELTLKAYSLSKVVATKYYKLGKLHAMKIYNNAKNLTLVYYKISRNMTIEAVHICRNRSLMLFNLTRNMTFRGLEYLNNTVKPEMIVYYGKGKVYVINLYKKGNELAEKSLEDLKIWYAENKEKMVEELYGEVYGAVEVRVNKVQGKAKELIEGVKTKVLTQIKILNKTIRNITMEVLSVYNQTKNVSIIAGNQLVAIFAPYAKIAQNRSMDLFLQLKGNFQDMDFHKLFEVRNMTILYINKAKAFTILNFNKAKISSIELYRNITNREDFKQFMAKHQIKERYDKMITKAKEITEKVKAFINETRPKVEAEYKKAMHYVFVILPDRIKEKKVEIMANPKEYAKNIYFNATNRIQELIAETKRKVNELIKDTAVEQVIMHEIWSDYVQEFKQHELVGVSKDIAEYGLTKVNDTMKIVAVTIKTNAEVLKQKIKDLKLKMKNKTEEIIIKAKKMYNETKLAVIKGFNDLKQMKLREIVEHRYVFRTIEFTKNTSLKIQNVTKQAKTITLKWVAIGKVYYKNMTIKARDYYTKVIKKYALELKENYTIVYRKVEVITKKYIVIAKNYIAIVKGETMKAYKSALNKTLVIVNITRVWINNTADECIELYKTKVIPYYKNKVLPFYNNKVLPLYQMYSKLAKEYGKNVTKRAYESEAYKFTLKSYNVTLDLLRNATKTTPRQTAIRMKQLSLLAYDFGLKTANKAVNLSNLAYNETMKQLKITKIQLANLMDVTLKIAKESMKPLIPLLNFTKNEIIETIIFIDKYYGIEDLLRERVRQHYQKFQVRYLKLNKTLMQHYGKMQKDSEKIIQTIPGLMKTSAYEALELINKTIRFTHFSLGYINSTVIRLRQAMPELKNYIRIEKGVIVIIIPHPRPVEGDIVSICTDACNAVKRLPETAKNMSRKALTMSKMYAMKAFNMSQNWLEFAMATPAYQKVEAMTTKLITATKNHPMAKLYLNTTINFLKATREYLRDINLNKIALKIKHHPMIKKYVVSTVNYVHMTRKYLRELNFKKIANLTRSYAPIAYNMTRDMLKLGYNTTRNYTLKYANIVWDISSDIYNSPSTKHAFLKVKGYGMKAYNETMKHYRALAKKHQENIEQFKAYASNQEALAKLKVKTAISKAQNVYLQVINITKSHPIIQEYVNSTVHFINVTRNFVHNINLTKVAKLAKRYAPIAIKMSRDMCNVGVQSARNFTMKVSNVAWNITIDIYNSTSLRMAIVKAMNHSEKARNEILKLYRILYKKIMEKYAELDQTSRRLYERITNHTLTKKYLGHARRYYAHTLSMMESRSRHFHHVKKYWRHRIVHKMNHFRNLLSPIFWIPPFNSSAVIFGKSHVYTFDSKYFTFPGYNNNRCTYILARDTRDNKFTLMSKETALIFVAEDANVKIHADGKVETMTKITYDGVKIRDGYDSELPVQSQNMTVAREGPFVVLRHTLGIEILCDIEHYLCTFNIGKWYHGRLAGLLGTNNNEQYDEMIKPNGRMAVNVIDFVNSWEVTNEPGCQIKKAFKPKPKCGVSKYIQRCRDLFKNLKSPFAPFFKIINPKPYMEACEMDYTMCDKNTPKDMKHCNVSATYIQLLRMKGQWVDYLPECGRCGNHELGRKWFQSAKNAVDIILVVPETQGMEGFAKKIPAFVNELESDLGKYSLRFGLVGFGGKGIHSHPHDVTMNGKFLGTAEQVKYAIDHLRFSDTQDKDIDGFEGISKASMYPFRAGATKIIILWTTSERAAHSHAPSLRRMTKELEMRDITLNVIGKYQKYSGDVNGQDYLGKVFYRKMTRGSRIGSSLPEGEFLELMKNTKGSAFSISTFGSDNRKRYFALKESLLNTLNEQIKRDQVMCKECFCRRGRVGEGRAICKINKHHQC